MVHLWVVDDLACQKNAAIWKFCKRFVCILDSPFDAVTKTEFGCQQEGHAADFQPEAVGTHHINDMAAVILVKLWKDFGTKAKSLLVIHLVHLTSAEDCNMWTSVLISPVRKVGKEDY